MSNKPKKTRNTITKSISFDEDVYKAMELHREGLRMTRSEYLRAVTEHVLGFLEHPELFKEERSKSVPARVKRTSRS